MKHVSLGCVLVLSLVLAAAPAGAQVVFHGKSDLVPSGKGWGERLPPGQSVQRVPDLTAQANGIFYHGGPVILGTTNVYFIWYGNWSGNSALSILSDLARSIGGSGYYNINTTYFNGAGQHVANSVHYGGAVLDSYSHGTVLTDTELRDVVSNVINLGFFPPDSRGVYFVLTSADVNESSGFCTQFCGFHTRSTIAGTDIKYAFVGNPDRCPSACEAQTTGPNGNAGADGMASILAHELDEAVTDPDLNAWFDGSGRENADKCAFTFGPVFRTSNGAFANVHIGSRNYLLQENWVNAGGGFCAQSF